MTALTITTATPLTGAEPFLRCMVGGHAGRNGALAATTDLVLTDAEHLGPLSEVQGLIGPGSTVFVPEGSIVGSRRNGARIVEYAGDLTALGEEILLAGELPVRVEAYQDLESLIITGPTIVRIASEDDFLAFLADAHTALTTGEFPDTLTHPDVWLADACCLAGDDACGGISRLFVNERGELRASLRGRVLGIVGDSVELLETRAEHRPCACTEIPAAAHLSAHEAYPWLPRYVAALQALRRMRAYDRRHCRVSGFGTRLVPGLELDRVESLTAPLLVWDRAGCVVFSLCSRRASQITVDDGRLLELTFVGGSRVAAAALAEKWLGLDGTTARLAIERVVAEISDRRLDRP
jgi:hypothetical protein